MPHAIVSPAEVDVETRLGGSTWNPAEAPSAIEILNATRIALSDEYERLESAETAIRKHGTLEADILYLEIVLRLDAIVEDLDGIFSSLALQQPKTAREIGIMLRALDFHMDLAAHGFAEREDEEKRKKRGDMVERILVTVRAASQSYGETAPQDVQVTTSRATDELLAKLMLCLSWQPANVKKAPRSLLWCSAPPSLNFFPSQTFPFSMGAKWFRLGPEGDVCSLHRWTHREAPATPFGLYAEFLSVFFNTFRSEFRSLSNGRPRHCTPPL